MNASSVQTMQFDLNNHCVQSTALKTNLRVHNSPYHLFSTDSGHETILSSVSKSPPSYSSRESSYLCNQNKMEYNQTNTIIVTPDVYDYQESACSTHSNLPCSSSSSHTSILLKGSKEKNKLSTKSSLPQSQQLLLCEDTNLSDSCLQQMSFTLDDTANDYADSPITSEFLSENSGDEDEEDNKQLCHVLQGRGRKKQRKGHITLSPTTCAQRVANGLPDGLYEFPKLQFSLSKGEYRVRFTLDGKRRERSFSTKVRGHLYAQSAATQLLHLIEERSISNKSCIKRSLPQHLPPIDTKKLKKTSSSPENSIQTRRKTRQHQQTQEDQQYKENKISCFNDTHYNYQEIKPIILSPTPSTIHFTNHPQHQVKELLINKHPKDTPMNINQMSHTLSNNVFVNPLGLLSPLSHTTQLEASQLLATKDSQTETVGANTASSFTHSVDHNKVIQTIDSPTTIASNEQRDQLLRVSTNVTDSKQNPFNDMIENNHLSKEHILLKSPNLFFSRSDITDSTSCGSTVSPGIHSASSPILSPIAAAHYDRCPTVLQNKEGFKNYTESQYITYPQMKISNQELLTNGIVNEHNRKYNTHHTAAFKDPLMTNEQYETSYNNLNVVLSTLQSLNETNQLYDKNHHDKYTRLFPSIKRRRGPRSLKKNGTLIIKQTHHTDIDYDYNPFSRREEFKIESPTDGYNRKRFVLTPAQIQILKKIASFIPTSQHPSEQNTIRFDPNGPGWIITVSVYDWLSQSYTTTDYTIPIMDLSNDTVKEAFSSGLLYSMQADKYCQLTASYLEKEGGWSMCQQT